MSNIHSANLSTNNLHRIQSLQKNRPDQFRLKELAIWQQWESMYNQLSPASFTEQKKFLINKIRRRFLLVAQETEKKQ